MKRWTIALLALGALAVTVATLEAQRQRGRGKGEGRGRGAGMGASMVGLLGQKSVQDELKLSEDQLKKLGELREKQRGSFGELRNLDREARRKKMEEMRAENEKALADVLKPEQLKRLKQISLQVGGASAFADPKVADELKLTSEQKDKIQSIQQESRQSLRGLFQGGGDREEARKKFAEARKSANEKAMAVLTPEQQSKWKEMTGEPFKGEIRFGGGQGGRGRRNR